MAFTFPGSPSDGDQHLAGDGLTYRYRAAIAAWELVPEAYGETKTEYHYIGTAGDDTVISGVDENGKTLSYTQNYVDVFVNGIKLVSGVDFTETDTSTITLTSDVPDGADIQIVAAGMFSSADVYNKNEVDGLLASAGTQPWREMFTATGGETVVTIPNSQTYVVGSDSLIVSIEGTIQIEGVLEDYTETSTTSVTFTQPLTAGEKVVFQGV
jgi:hypothetical protein